MRTIGLIGGMSWESTVTYYEVINEEVKDNLGGLHSAKILMYSVDFYEVEKHMNAGEWEEVAAIIGDAAMKLETAGADCILICTNTIHKIAPQVKAKLRVPLLHIAEATAEKLNQDGIKKAILLGTKYTMQQDFYREVLEQHGIVVVIPKNKDIEIVNHVIFDELCLGIVKEESKQEYVRIIEELQNEGAQAVILGCTELGMLLHKEDTPLPLYDTTIVHAKKAAEYALSMSVVHEE